MPEKQKRSCRAGIRVGDLARVIWTAGVGELGAIGLVTRIEYNGGMDYKPRYDRLRALLFCQGSPTWLDADDLEVVSAS